jgi:para-aminobenzoate synthetase / 4-amino-4-deoxychorismate lyase
MNHCVQLEERNRALPQWAEQPGFVLLRDGKRWRVYKEPTEILIACDGPTLMRALERIEQHVKDGGEAAGYLSYEAGYALEPRLFPLLAKWSGQLCWFGLYQNATVVDEISRSEALESHLLRSFQLSIKRNEYRLKLDEIRQLIEAGEVYQVNFTARVNLQAKRNAWEMFSALVERHPVPHAAFVNTGAEQIVSLSPELFFEIESGHIRVKPMKGTAARGRTLEEDLIAADQLRGSDKDRAENVMIVDLMRNDLGRICRAGSIRTTSLFEVERYPSLWQMTSTACGELRDGYTIEAILRALLPSGSVTGAPKIRAMEHIARLENSPRGVYTGGIGFFAPEHARFNVAIRTVTMQNGQGTMGIGSGVVYDSDPLSEWEECKSKAAFLLQSEPEFEIIETLYWNGKFRLLDQHLDRMRSSAEYFGFSFEERKLRFDLQKLAAEFSSEPKRVRILLSRDGKVQITCAEFLAKRFGQVGISRERVSSHDRFLFHKTTNRDLYVRELTLARKRKLDDVLFFNENGELTEGAIHNVFVVKDGAWQTPPVSCGLLPGTYRAQILKTRANSRETILRLADLQSADAVYLCNSVQGLFPVEVVWDAETRSSAPAEGELSEVNVVVQA